MNRQTSDQGWQKLQARIEGLFNEALRKEKENHPESFGEQAGSHGGRSDTPVSD